MGGNQGLDIDVLQGAPPSIIEDRGLTSFSFVMMLENKGEADVGPGTPNPFVVGRLTGIAPRDFGLTPETSAKQLEFKLTAAKRNFDGTVLVGEVGDITFNDLSYKPNIFDSISLTIRGEVCYDYQTFASVKFCMKQEPIDYREDSTICDLRGPLPYGNSGSPLHITGVSQRPAGEGIQIAFTVEHVGNGAFFSRKETDFWKACDFTEMNPEIYKADIEISAVEGASYAIECPRLTTGADGRVSGTLRMPQSTPASVVCFVTSKGGTESRLYEDMLEIKLKYRYFDFIEVPIVIEGNI